MSESESADGSSVPERAVLRQALRDTESLISSPPAASRQPPAACARREPAPSKQRVRVRCASGCCRHWPAPPAAGDQASLEALDVLTDELDPEFYEDLDLYRWLAQPATESPRV